WMGFFDFGKILFWWTITYAQIAIFGQEAEVCQRINVRAPVLQPIELRLWKDVVHLEPAHSAKKIRLQRKAGSPVPRFTHPGEHVEDRIEPGAEAPAGEGPRLNSQAAMPKPKLLDESIEAALE